MLRDRMLGGLHAGLIVASATAGALVGFAWRRGMPARPFNTAAMLLVGDRAQGVWGFQPAITLGGILVHVVWAVLVGVLFAFVASTLRGLWLLVAAVAFAAILFVLGPTVAPPHLRSDAFAVEGPARAALIYLALAAALVVGIRLARSRG